MPFYFLPIRRFALAAWCALSVPMLHAQEPPPANETLVEIKAIAGLRFDVPRFRVAPEAKVRVVLENTDDMAHNLLILAPGARVEIVTAAMTMPITPTQDFVPKSEKVLWTIPVLTPGKKGEVSFTAPKKEGVYPYVCSYPGHGFIMFGAMYVSKKTTLPPLEKDANVPDTAKEQSGKALHAFTPKPPYLYRMFVRDSGPASIAVALPGEQNYVWDAGACRLRYAWRGAFLDPSAHWGGNGDAFAEVLGRIYWRAGAEFPLRLGARDRVPVVKFCGYRLVEKYPEFRYEVDGVEVRELIKAQHHGGIQDTFTIGAAKGPVFYATEPDGGAAFAASVGQFKDGVLQLTAEQARNFTVTLTEIPGKEPLAYWSMNDNLKDKKPLPVAGVNGRAIIFDGKKSQFATGVKIDALKAGGTIAFWAKLTKPEAKNQVFIGATCSGGEFEIGTNLGSPGFNVALTVNGAATAASTGQPADDGWHHLAATLSANSIGFYFDGKSWGSIPAATLPDGAELFLGSAGGKNFAAATLDEVRIYDRVLTVDEIQAVFAREQKAASFPISK
ncbi:MAG: LamG-like jellyroll fold domain-containing protein [Chthoniobacteraceae bacterium]